MTYAFTFFNHCVFSFGDRRGQNLTETLNVRKPSDIVRSLCNLYELSTEIVPGPSDVLVDVPGSRYLISNHQASQGDSLLGGLRFMETV